MTPSVIFSAGDCPVCSKMGAMLFVKAAETGMIFFLCPMCGTAWKTPPKSSVVDEIGDPKQISPEGVELASKEDIEDAGFADVIVSGVPAQDWIGPLQEYLRK